MILVDTDILIDALRGRNPAREIVAARLQSGSLATTSISLFELASGARSERESKAIADLVAVLRILPFDGDAARSAAAARRSLEEIGQTIGMADFLISGIALSRQLPVLTRNRTHFERVPGLVLADLDSSPQPQAPS